MLHIVVMLSIIYQPVKASEILAFIFQFFNAGGVYTVVNGYNIFVLYRLFDDIQSFIGLFHQLRIKRFRRFIEIPDPALGIHRDKSLGQFVHNVLPCQFQSVQQIVLEYRYVHYHRTQ